MKAELLKKTCRKMYEKAASSLVEGLVERLLTVDDEEGLVAVTSEILEGQCQGAMPLTGRVDSENVSKLLEST